MIRIEEARKAEYVAIANLYRRVVLNISSGNYTYQQLIVWSESLNPETLQQITQNSIIYLAYMEGKLAGFGIMRHDGYVSFLYVAKEFQRLGVGRKLLKQLEQTARKWKLDSLYLDASLNAIPFYQKEDFQPYRKIVIVRKGVPFLCWRMKKDLCSEREA